MKTITLYAKLWAHKILEPLQKSRKDENSPATPIYKRKTVESYAQKYSCNIFVETGTYLGEMIEYQERNFEKIFSIEIADLFYNFSTKRLKKKKKISIVKGNSGTELGMLLKQFSVDDRILFWLDGHYSGGNTGKGEKNCPIYEELNCIFKGRDGKDIILIDDARCFNGTEDYPDLIELERFIKDRYSEAKINVKEDIIRVILT